jgi:hypothetical protein
MIISIALFSGCDTGGGGGTGDGTDPFGGGGGGGGDAAGNLTGTWTTVSATGTVNYSNASLASLVNRDMQTYELDDVLLMTLNADKSFAIVVGGSPKFNGTYSLSGNALTLTDQQKASLTLNLTVSGSEFTCDASGSGLAYWIAWCIGEYELQQAGYGGMTETGVEVTAYNLTLKFKKK